LISASKTNYRHYNLKILRPKVTKNIKNLHKKFCEFPPWPSTSISTTILCPTLPVHSTRSYTQLLHFTFTCSMLCARKISINLLVQLAPGVNFINILRTAFMLVDPKSVKNTVMSKVYFYAFGICEHKSCT